MEEGAKVELKHIALLKFKDGLPQDQIYQLIQAHADLVNRIPPLKAFRWGMAMEILGGNDNSPNHGFSHVFESTFETREGIMEYETHPAHKEFVQAIVPHLEKFLVVNYEPTTLHL